MLRRIVLSAVLLAAISTGSGADTPTPSDAKAALRKATDYLTSISTEGGYLWRYSADLRERRGETEATPTQIWVQPPGTPSVGMAFLDAWNATQDERHLTAAQAAAFALARGQLESGGWSYLVEFDPKQRRSWAYRMDAGEGETTTTRPRNTTTFDDNNTQSALRFLLAFLDAARNRPSQELKTIRDAADYGLAKLIEAQYPNGAWPQRYDGKPHDRKRHPVQPARIPENWPREWPKADYSGFYTLNDHTQHDCIETLLDAYRRRGERKYLEAALRGGEFLIRAQLPEPQPAWAQQYNFDMEPAWARAFEPPAVCSAESAGVIRMLVDLYLETGDEKFLQPVPAAVAWLKRSPIEPSRWARYYELRTNKPIYGDRDGKIHYDLAEVSEERRRGYGWQGGFDIPQTIEFYEAVKKSGREKFLAERRERDERRNSRPSRTTVSRILAQQDSEGRWIANGWIEMRMFIANMRTLANYAGTTERPASQSEP